MKDERHETIEQSVTDCNHLGNTAKMREALEKIASMGEQIDYQLGSSEETVYAFRHERCIAHNISECARDAISAHPRNCDIGTVEEQAERFHSFCESNKKCGDVYSCERCQLNSIEDCELAWAQMPYEEGDEK